MPMASALTDWYHRNKRTLPWRDTGNPYDVWISEIMLQQTRVEAVIPRFLAFRRELPDIPALAACPPTRLMKLWEGMGYYSRARNLQKCAAVLAAEYGCELPAGTEELIRLPGIGPYTAGAIAAIAFCQPVPAVDGNVLRVLARIFAVADDIRAESTKTAITAAIADFYRREQISDPAFISAFTQALMELGALVCVPNGVPHCEACPLRGDCAAFREQLTDRIPYRSPLKQRRIVPLTVLVIRDGSRFALRRRPARGLLAGLYEFPNLPGHQGREEVIRYMETMQVPVLRIRKLPDARHVFTHLEWQMSGYELTVENMDTLPMPDTVLLTKKELQFFAVPSAFDVYMKYYDLRSEAS